MNLQQPTRFFPKNAATRSVSEDSSLADEKFFTGATNSFSKKTETDDVAPKHFIENLSSFFSKKEEEKRLLEFFFAKRRNFFSVLSENSRNVYSRLKRNRLREKRTKLTVTYISFHFVSLTLSRTLSHLTPTRTLSLSHTSHALFLRPDYDVFDIIFSRNDPFSCFDNFLIASEKKKKLKISILSLF